MNASTDLLEVFDLFLKLLDAHRLELSSQKGTSTVILNEHVLVQYLDVRLFAKRNLQLQSWSIAHHPPRRRKGIGRQHRHRGFLRFVDATPRYLHHQRTHVG